MKKILTYIMVFFSSLSLTTGNSLANQDINSSPLADEMWERLGGPFGGIGYDIVVDQTNPDIMYVTDAAALGLFKSIDGGLTWFPSNGNIYDHIGKANIFILVFSVRVDPNDSNILWMGMFEDGEVYKSIDGGESWELRTNGINNRGFVVRGFGIQPGDSDVVYVAGEISSFAWAGEERRGDGGDMTQGIVYKTTDGGLNWRQVWRGDNLARYVLIDPTNTQIVYVSTGIFDREAANFNAANDEIGGVGILKSYDGGESWQQINNGLGNLYIGSLAMHPTNPNILLAASGHIAHYEEGTGIYRTENGGENWTYVGGYDITSVDFSHSNPNIAYAANREHFYISKDSGRRWIELQDPDRFPEGIVYGNYFWGPQGVTPGHIIDIQVDPRDPSRVFVNGYGGGNFISEDYGNTWQIASKGYSAADIYDVSVSPLNPAIVFVNAMSGTFRSNDGGADWEGITPINLGISGGALVRSHPTDLDFLICDGGGVIAYSLDGGGTWTRSLDVVDEENALGLSLQDIAYSPSNPEIVYGALGFDHCIRNFNDSNCQTPTKASLIISKDGGISWEINLSVELNGFNLSSVVAHPTDPEVAWVGSLYNGILKTEDMGESWTNRSSGLEDRVIISLAIDPTNPDVLYAGTNMGLYKSTDAGLSWEVKQDGLSFEEIIRSIVIDPIRPNVIYAGSEWSGVYYSDDGGELWKELNNNLNFRNIYSLGITNDGETLYAGVRFAGVYRLSIHDQSYYDALIPEQTLQISDDAEEVITTDSYEIPVVSTSAPDDAGKENPVLCLGSFIPLIILAIILTFGYISKRS